VLYTGCICLSALLLLRNKIIIPRLACHANGKVTIVVLVAVCMGNVKFIIGIAITVY
jgi:hypothetical protein